MLQCLYEIKVQSPVQVLGKVWILHQKFRRNLSALPHSERGKDDSNEVPVNSSTNKGLQRGPV